MPGCSPRNFSEKQIMRTVDSKFMYMISDTNTFKNWLHGNASGNAGTIVDSISLAIERENKRKRKIYVRGKSDHETTKSCIRTNIEGLWLGFEATPFYSGGN